MTMEMKLTCELYNRLKVMKNEILKFIKGKGVKKYCRALECATYFRTNQL